MIPAVRPPRAALAVRATLAVLGALLACAAAAGPARAGADPAVRGVLVELVGERECPGCVDARDAIEALEDELGERRVVTLELHGTALRCHLLCQ